MGSKEVVVRGRTVEDARLIASKTLKVDESQLRIEVVSRGRKGFFGFFKRPAAIRVTVVPQKKSQEGQNCGYEPELDGTAGVSEGRLRVWGPRGKGEPAVVIPTSGVILRVNGVVVHSPRPISQDDEVDIETVEEVHSARVEVEISDDGFIASVRVSQQVTIRHELMDQGPQNVLQLLTRRHEERAKVITPAQIEEALKAKGVTVGLDYEEILRAADAADGIPRVVARGEPVKEGRNGFVEYLFNRKPTEIVHEEEERADYWERYVYPSVKEGDVLAVLHPPVPGTPGKKVTGEMVMPRPVSEAVLRVKDGVKLSEDGRRAVAVIAGRPVLEGRWVPYLRVVRLMVHSGNIDIKSGNVRFWGDLLILGNVTEGAEVSAHGDITIIGDATGAALRAGGKVVCRGNLIGSRVHAGGLKSLYSRLAPILNDLQEILGWIIQETTRIQQHPSNRRRLKKGDINRIVRLFIERKKKELDAIATEYTIALQAADLPFPPAIRELVQDIARITLGPVGRTEPIPDDLKSILEKKEEVDYLLDSLPDQPGDILCSYVQNSVLEASGSIIVTNEGCFDSTLRSGKQVEVKGVFRGGKIQAMGSVFVKEAGSPGLSAGKVKIKAAEQSTIRILKVYPETTVQVGGRSHVFDKEGGSVRVYLGPKGDLTIEAFRV
ncbi:MAG: flagellar assembly protein A [Clostridia bacterium]